MYVYAAQSTEGHLSAACPCQHLTTLQMGLVILAREHKGAVCLKSNSLYSGCSITLNLTTLHPACVMSIMLGYRNCCWLHKWSQQGQRVCLLLLALVWLSRLRQQHCSRQHWEAGRSAAAAAAAAGLPVQAVSRRRCRCRVWGPCTVQQGQARTAPAVQAAPTDLACLQAAGRAVP